MFFRQRLHRIVNQPTNVKSCLFALIALIPVAGCVIDEAGLVQSSRPTTVGSVRTGPSDLNRALTLEFAEPGGTIHQNKIVLIGARGETVTCELRFRALKPLAPPDLWTTNFQSAESGADLAEPAVSRLLAIPNHRRPGWDIRDVAPQRRSDSANDVVLPTKSLNNAVLGSLQPGEVLAVFFELTIPQLADPGEYGGRLLVRSNGRDEAEVAMSILVRPIALPQQESLPAFVGLDYRSIVSHALGEQTAESTAGLEAIPAWDSVRLARVTELLSSSVEILHRHRLTPMFSNIWPVIKLQPPDRVQVDWSDWDRMLEPFLAGSPPENRPCWFELRLGEKNPLWGTTQGQTPSADAPYLRALLREFAEHFAQRGWLDRLLVRTPDFQMHNPSALTNLTRWIDIISSADSRLLIASDVAVSDRSDPTWERVVQSGIHSHVDIWVPPARFCDPGVADNRGSTWLHVSRPPYSGTLMLPADATDVWAIPWQARRYHLDGVYLGVANRWPEQRPLSTPQACAEFDASVLIYPGRYFGLESPLASLRLKHLRRAMEDQMYVDLLHRHERPHIARMVANGLVPYALTDAFRHHFADPKPRGWSDDREIWWAARRIMGDELQSVITGEAAAPSDSDSAVIRWRQFLTKTRTILLFVEGLRVRPTRDPAQLRIECTLRVENRTSEAVSGTVAIADWPVGWQSETDNVKTGPVSPGQSRRVVLSILATGIGWGANGAVAVPFVFTSPQGESCQATGRLAYVASARLSDVRIDGDASEWGTIGTNLASDFQPISGLATGGGAMSDQPSNPSPWCMIAHDQEAIYFAIRCPADSQQATRSVSRSAVHYEDGIPVGEDLIEILLDPSNAGTHSPEDLFHVVIKRSGAAVFERGVSITPQMGQRWPWPADVRYAIAEVDGAWMVEARVPARSFGLKLDGPQVWGLNVTHFDASAQSYSTWSGATFNAYDPQSLGNLMIPW